MEAGFFILKIFGLMAQKRELNKKKTLLSAAVNSRPHCTDVCRKGFFIKAKKKYFSS